MFTGLIKCFRFRFVPFMWTDSRRYVSFYRPRRAILYVPGDSEKKIRKTLNLKVDCVAFDCEDGVANNQKQAARCLIRSFFDTNSLGISTEWAVRVNSLDSNMLADDLMTIMAGQNLPETILLPKVNNMKSLDYFSTHIKNCLKNRKEKVNLILYAESCQSLVHLPQICSHAIELSKHSPFVPVGIVFGSDDFCASLGAIRTESSIEILYARQKIVSVAKAFNLQAIDMVYIDFKNLVGLKAQCLDGAGMGYTGKQVIHPQQINIVQEAFYPTQGAIKWAEELLAAYEMYQKCGKGAFVHKNKMIDAPTMKQARNIIDIVRKYDEKNTS